MKPNGNSKINFGRSVRFTIDPASLDKARYLVKKVPTECQWYFAIEVISTDKQIEYHLHDFFVPHQEVSAAYVESTPGEIAKAVSALKAERNLTMGQALTVMSTMSCWCHSHVHMAASPSSTDDTSWKDQKALALSGGSDHPQAMIILNKKDEYFIRVYDPRLELEWENVPLEFSRPEPVMTDVDELITSRLKPRAAIVVKTQTYSGGYSHSVLDDDYDRSSGWPGYNGWPRDKDSKSSASSLAARWVADASWTKEEREAYYKQGDPDFDPTLANKVEKAFLEKAEKKGWQENLKWSKKERDSYWLQDNPSFDPTGTTEASVKAKAESAMSSYRSSRVSSYKAGALAPASKNTSSASNARSSTSGIQSVEERLQRLEEAVVNSQTITVAKRNYNRFLSAIENYLGPAGIVAFASLYLIIDTSDLNGLVRQCLPEASKDVSDEVVNKSESLLFDAWIESGEDWHTSSSAVYALIKSVRNSSSDEESAKLIMEFMDKKALLKSFTTYNSGLIHG